MSKKRLCPHHDAAFNVVATIEVMGRWLCGSCARAIGLKLSPLKKREMAASKLVREWRP